MKRIFSTIFLVYCCFAGMILHAQTPQYSFIAGTSSNAVPFNSTQKAQWLFLPYNLGLNKQQVKIRNVYFRTVTTAPMVKQTNLTIRLSSIAQTAFPAATWIAIGDTSLFLPVSEAAVTNRGWLKYELQKPFVYDTLLTQGLIVDAHSSADDGSYDVGGGSGYTNRRLYGLPDDVSPTRDANLPDFGFDIVPDIANNAGVQALVMPTSFCPGTQGIRVKIFNNGNNAINNVVVNWELNGSAQTAIPLNTVLNVFGGTGKSDTTILLGNINIPATGVNLRVWTASPNGVTDPLTSDDTLITVVKPSMTGTYTIGPSGNYTTFTAALTDLHKLGSCGTTIFNVAAGASFKEAPIAVNNLGNFGGPVIFQKSGVGANPLISGIDGVGTSDAVITLNGTNFVTFDGIDVEDSSTNPTSTRQMEFGYRIRALNATVGATDNTIKNCRVRVLRTNTSTIAIVQTAAGTPAGGITPTTSNGVQKRNRYENVKIMGGFKGIQLFGNASFPDSGCVITSTNGDTTIVDSVGSSANSSAAIFGINLTNQRDADVSGCLIRYNFHNGSMTGAETQGISITNTGSAALGNVRIFNNRIHSLSRTTGTITTGAFVYGIKVDLSATATATVYNNIIYNLNAAGPAAASAVQIIRAIAHGPETGNGNASYYNNTVHISPTTGTLSSASFYKAGTSTATLRNNIFSNAHAAQSGVAKHYAVNVIAGSIVSSHNLFWTPNTNGVLALVTSDKATVATYATAISSTLPSDGQERGSAYADPNFTSAATGDFTFAGPAPAAKSGTPIAGITTDITGAIRNTVFPAIGAYETARPQLDSSAPVIGNVTVINGATPIVRASINDNSNSATAGNIQLWYRMGTSGAFVPLVPDSLPTGTMNGTYKWGASLAGLSVGNYQFYIAARDQVGAGLNIAFNPLQNASFTGVSTVDPANYVTNPNAGANLNAFIKTQIITGGTYTIGSGGNYANLTEVATALNSAEVTGNLTFEFLGNYVSTNEVFPITFNQFTSIGGGPWKVTIRPGLTASGIETSGYSSGTSLITLNGVKKITFDGRAGGVGSTGVWTIRSKRSSSVNVPAFVIVNGSREDTLTYLKVESGSTANILFSTSTTGVGNGRNVVAYCDVTNRTDSVDIPAAGIQSDGTDLSVNDSSFVYGNKISNFSGNGVQVTATGNGNAWNISGNHFFYSLAGASAAQTAIRVVPGTSTSGHIITGNMIGGQAANASGGKWANSGAIAWRGIVLTANNSGDSSLVNNNIVRNIDLTGTGTSASFVGIEVTTSKTSLHHNMIGDSATANSITFTGSSSAHAGISLGSSVTVTYYNVIANLSCTATGSTTASTTLRGIAASSSTSTEIIIRNNLVKNLSTTALGNTATFNALTGIHTTPSNPNQRITDNVVFGLSCIGNAVASKCVGIQVGNNSGGGNISRNLVYDIKHTGTSTTAQAAGIRVLSGVNWTVDNNMVSIGSGTDSAIVAGIQDTCAATTLNVFYNTVHINGTNQSATAGRSYAFAKDYTSIINVRNNIFNNERVGAGFNHAVRVVNTTIGWKGNYNVMNTLTASNTGVWGGTAYDLATWKTTTLQDTASVQTPVSFVSATDLHLVSPSLGNYTLAGKPLALTSDFDGQTRHSTSPYMGADESLSNPLPVTLIGFSASTFNVDVKLNWSTASEIDASHFEIERSADGQHFAKVGSVRAAGASSHKRSYLFTDEKAFAVTGSDMLYYRLKMVDRNTHAEYSHIVTVSVNESRGDASLRTYPNPFTGEVFTTVYSNTATDAIISISDITGKEIVTTTQHLQAGDNTVSVKSLDHLREGIYFIAIDVNGEKHLAKIIKY